MRCGVRQFPGCARKASRPWAVEYNPFGVKTKTFMREFSDKQHFLNTVYERFFQGYSVKTADTHGIVYTPRPIIDFMCASVEEVLKSEFGLTLGSPGVNILDPCTGKFCLSST